MIQNSRQMRSEPRTLFGSEMQTRQMRNPLYVSRSNHEVFEAQNYDDSSFFDDLDGTPICGSRPRREGSIDGGATAFAIFVCPS